MSVSYRYIAVRAMPASTEIRPTRRRRRRVEAQRHALELRARLDRAIRVRVAEPTVLETTERQRRVLYTHGVAEDRSSLQSVSHPQHPLSVRRPHRRAQAVL